MRGWTVQTRREDKEGFSIEETKYIFLPDERWLAPIYYERFDSDFSAIERRVRLALAKSSDVWVYVEKLGSDEEFVARIFFSGDSVRIVTPERDEVVPFEEGKKFLQKTLIRLKKQAKDACWLVATA